MLTSHLAPYFSCQIIAFEKGVPVVNSLVLGNLIEYRSTSYSAES